jgi:hypothetical protein
MVYQNIFVLAQLYTLFDDPRTLTPKLAVDIKIYIEKLDFRQHQEGGGQVLHVVVIAGV